MSFLCDNIDITPVYVRGEYMRNLEQGHGEFAKGIAHAVRCRRGYSIYFLVALLEPYGGAQFWLPIEALTWRPGAPVRPVRELQEYDCLSDTFAFVELRLLARGAAKIIRTGEKAQYRFTLDFGCGDLSDYPEQHKSLHVVWLEDGNIGAYPNNRIVFEDPAFWKTLDRRPDFEALDLEARAEVGFDAEKLRRKPAVFRTVVRIPEYLQKAGEQRSIGELLAEVEQEKVSHV